MNINREKFYAAWRREFARLKTQAMVDRINRLIDYIEHDSISHSLEQYAYMLATIKHETGHTFKPLREWGRGFGRIYGKKNAHTGKRYYGRGYVQLTWAMNYMSMSKLLRSHMPERYNKFGKDFLYYNPDMALQPDISYDIITLGMKLGSFTGKKLDDYINSNKKDYKRARKIINGMDRADLIAGYARKFEIILKESVIK